MKVSFAAPKRPVRPSIANIFEDDEEEAASKPVSSNAKLATAEPTSTTSQTEFDEETKHLILKTAEWTVKKGRQFEEYTLKMNQTNPKFRFLTDPSCAEAIFYRDQVARLTAETPAIEALQTTALQQQQQFLQLQQQQLQQQQMLHQQQLHVQVQQQQQQQAVDALARAQAQARAIVIAQQLQLQLQQQQTQIKQEQTQQTPPPPPPPPQQQQQLQPHTVEGLVPVVSAEPRRKRRWDDSSNGSSNQEPAIIPISQAPVQQRSKSPSTVPLPGMVKVGKVWIYPEDEDTSGGTWEHRKRLQEMKETEEKARQLTEAAKERHGHHLADFLPKEELEKFNARVRAAKTGEELQHSDYEQNKLTESNVGFQMLKNSGWEEGQGLGSTGGGIINPINLSDLGPERAGLGQEKPDAPDSEDDAFELYRKRMMVAYKFRPNPLNNPRRQYY